MEMLAEIDEDTVDFRPNYDESRDEPTVLPAQYPNLLVNGAGGIAVGMATNIPPHNLTEICNGAIAIIAGKKDTVPQPPPGITTGATIDRFVLWISATDPKWHAEGAQQFARSLGAGNVRIINGGADV